MLMALSRDFIFPKILALIAVGGLYEGYLPVIQGDNAGPHTDATFMNYVMKYCEDNGWKWELQAPQMPHLAVFPAMSKRHSTLLQDYSNSCAPSAEIWKAAESVWSNLESAEIARGFLLAYRIAKKVIDNKGTNTFLQKREFHSDVRKDFADSTKGVVKKVNVIG